MAEAAPAVPSDELLEWPKKDKRRFLLENFVNETGALGGSPGQPRPPHGFNTLCNKCSVGDLERTIKFYTECFGMKLLRQRDIPEEKYSNAFLGFGPEESNFVVELTYNYGVDKYDIGTGFGHFTIATTDVYKMVEDIRAKGGNITWEPGPVKGGKSVIAFVKDPDGYTFELILRPPTLEPLCQVTLRVGDLERSIKFYEMVAISTDDVYKSGEVVNLVTQELGRKVTRQPGPIPGLNTKITSFLDPDGWKTVLVDNQDFLKELEKE